MMILLALAAATATPAPPPPVAVVAPPPPPVALPAVNPARVAAARNLLTAMNVTAMYDSMFERVVPLITVQVFNQLKNDARLPASVRASMSDTATDTKLQLFFADEAKKELKARYPRLLTAAAEAYGREFDVTELKELTAFYDTAVGKKALKVMPQIQERLFPIGANVGREAGEAAMRTTLQTLMPDDPPKKS